MEVLQENFSDELGAIIKGIKDCSGFMSLDFELTGLYRSEDDPISLPSLEDRFQRAKRAVETFSPCQFGLSLFEPALNDGFHVSVYSIYIFPRPFKAFSPRFAIASASADFLARHDFDFNKWIKHGVGYLPREAEEKIRADLQREFGQDVNLDDEATKKLEELEDAVGFRRVIEEIVHSKKLLVGHHCLLDFLYLYSILGPVGNSHEEFKARFHEAFPRIVDTKTIIQMTEGLAENMGGSLQLHSIFERIKSPPFVVPNTETINFGGYGDVSMFHDAGFDSYSTGLIFLSLLKHLAPLETYIFLDASTTEALANVEAQPWHNTVAQPNIADCYVNFAGQDCPFSLGPAFVVPIVDDVLFVGPVETNLTQKIIYDHFRKSADGFRIKWKDATSFFLEFDKGVLNPYLTAKFIEENRGGPFPVMTFAEYSKRPQVANVPPQPNPTGPLASATVNRDAPDANVRFPDISAFSRSDILELTERVVVDKKGLSPSSREGKVFLFCPLTEREEAKALGAKFDKIRKLWFVYENEGPQRFARWMNPSSKYQYAWIYFLREICPTLTPPQGRSLFAPVPPKASPRQSPAPSPVQSPKRAFPFETEPASDDENAHQQKKARLDNF